MNYLLQNLSRASLTKIAYADDLVVLCDGDYNLDMAMDELESWAN